MSEKIDKMLEDALKQSFEDGYRKGFVDGYDESYAEQLKQPEPNLEGTISVTVPEPIGYLCENAVGHKYFRWKKPPSTYKPIALYTTPHKENT
jgi:hypothetical protein